MMPAVMPAESWSPASEGPTVSTEVPPFSKAIGRAPYRRLVARLLALDSVKLPLICALPFGITPLNVGAEMTLPSRTTANCSCEPAIARERSAKTCLPSPPRVRSTCHWTWPCGMPALALCRSVPSIAAGDRRYLVPASLPVPQVTSGLVASSSTGLFDGQLNLLNSVTAAGSGFLMNASAADAGSLLEGADEGEADGDAESLDEALGEDDGFADVVLDLSARNGGRFLELDLLDDLLDDLPDDDGDWGEVGADGTVGVVEAGAQLPVTPLGPSVHATVRKRNCACRLTVSTRSLRVLPGISTTIRLPPWVVTSASVTPEPLTRWSMIPRASASWSAAGVPLAVSVMRVPPCRSSPSAGFQVPPSATSP